ncbi:hypothetical protein KQI76_05335 [Amphibacillus sp. MSJ-3]|uniref:hypothetical protein n=1 Tax=Amphibacillus sp. MSJ-3 TaxID=2841505 RepID=UPI001C0F18B3|nr:hypothetical protein [Amphibacillus sp. MSJ-3]MBU5594579.1 hypothetical protein [Amphibacillus sp. MSJ-3]
MRDFYEKYNVYESALEISEPWYVPHYDFAKKKIHCTFLSNIENVLSFLVLIAISGYKFLDKQDQIWT